MAKSNWMAVGTIVVGTALGYTVASVQAVSVESQAAAVVASEPIGVSAGAAVRGRGPIVVHSAAAARSAAAQVAASGRKPNILVLLGRRHRHVERQFQQPRDDGLSHAEHRPHRA
jgi:hypothetical protein